MPQGVLEKDLSRLYQYFLIPESVAYCISVCSGFGKMVRQLDLTAV